AAARAFFRARLRSRLEALTTEQRSEVLLPLRQDESLDTCDIVAPLILDLGVQGTEVVPASAADGSGSEVSTTADGGRGEAVAPADAVVLGQRDSFRGGRDS